ncbi:hypothetical protein MVEN_00042100 [Mycena venus]|uniref:Uncharacterized protein n=1 Tax=Mycena venus TaxID=2733690 RepID=A0A8H6Z3D3_9AGAR|nr:hypothetical protein MVEN_00042100 [Mycena venus]
MYILERPFPGPMLEVREGRDGFFLRILHPMISHSLHSSLCGHQHTMPVALTYFLRLCKCSAISLATSASSRTERSLFQLPYGLVVQGPFCAAFVTHIVLLVVKVR